MSLRFFFYIMVGLSINYMKHILSSDLWLIILNKIEIIFAEKD